MSTLSVVIPAFNEEDGIQDIMRRVLAIRPQLASAGIADLELIVVDDGSTDRTPALVRAIPGARLAQHLTNGGYGAALKTGFAMARGEWIGFLDADGTYPPEEFPALCHVGAAQSADIVIGTRMAGAASRMPATRRLGNRIFAGLLTLISAQRVTDSASGMRIFRKCCLGQLYPLPDGLNLTPVMSTRALHEQLRVVEVPIPYSERVGRSKLSVVRDGMRFAQSMIWTALNYNPARLLGLAGGAALIGAVLIAVALLAVRLSGVATLSALGAFALFLGSVLAVAGVAMVALGISFNYFVALFHKQPVRQGLFGYPALDAAISRHVGAIGLASLGAGALLGILSLVSGLNNWPVSRLWLYYLACTSFLLVGIQLVVSWTQMQVLDALKARDDQVECDMRGRPCSAFDEDDVSSRLPLPQEEPVPHVVG